jgi:hypothetical protein
MYAIHLYGSSMRELILGVTATASVGDEPEGRGDSWGYGTEVISDDRFNISGFGACAIDDTPRSLSNDSGDLFLSGKSTGLLSVFRWTTGEFTDQSHRASSLSVWKTINVAT